MSDMNHIKRGESLENKQLVLINSNNRDDTDQGTTSFTYTFNKPIKRVSKMDVMFAKIPKSFYNVNNDNASMSITTTTLTKTGTETRTDTLVVDDTEIDSGNIYATNIADGSVVKTNTMDGSGDITVSRIVTKNQFIYVGGVFCDERVDFTNYTGVSANNQLFNNGGCDIFVAKYTINQELVMRFRIAGNIDDDSCDICVVDDAIFVSGSFRSVPLIFYNYDDTAAPGLGGSLVSDGSRTGFLAKYTLDGQFAWAVKITGIDTSASPVLVAASFGASDIEKKVFVVGSYKQDLAFYQMTDNPKINVPYVNVVTLDMNVFVAQYTYAGVLEWVSRIEYGGTATSVVINPHTNNIMVGFEYAHEYGARSVTAYSSSGGAVNITSAISITQSGDRNLGIFEFTTSTGASTGHGVLVDSLKIAGTGIESNIKMDVNNGVLVVCGLYTSSQLYFYNTMGAGIQTIIGNGSAVNMFIAKYDLLPTEKPVIWATSVYSASDISNMLDVSVSADGGVSVVGNYTGLLKFNEYLSTESPDVYTVGNDLINDTSSVYTFLVKYDTAGRFQHHSYIKTLHTIGGKTIGTSVDAHSDNTYIAGYYDTDIDLYNPDELNITKQIGNNTSSNNGYIVSYINNVNNYAIDDATLPRRILSKTLTGSDLHYVLNLNAFSQQLGLIEATRFQAMLFGTTIDPTAFIITESNNTLSLVFNVAIGEPRSFTEVEQSYKIGSGTYNPYNLAYVINQQILDAIRNSIAVGSGIFTNMPDGAVFKYDDEKNIFYCVFTIDGTVRVKNTSDPLVVLLKMSGGVSKHCVIMPTNLSDSQAVAIADNTKLTLRINQEEKSIIFNAVDFSTAFPAVSGSSGVLDISGKIDTNIRLIAGRSDDVLDVDLQAKDTVAFDAPWLLEDENEFAFKDALQWSDLSASADGKYVTAVVDGGHIYVSDTGGATWIQRESNRQWRAISVSYTGKVQTAVAFGGRIYLSTDCGKNWTPKELSRDWTCVAVSQSPSNDSDGQHQVAACKYGKVYISHDQGASWRVIGLVLDWKSVAVSSDGQIGAAVAFRGSLFVSQDGGDSWATYFAGENIEWQSIDMTGNGQTIVAITKYDKVYHSSDAGANWTVTIPSIMNGKLLNKVSVAHANGNQISVVGDAGSIYSTPDGVTGTWASNHTTESYSGISVSADGAIRTAIARGGGTYRSDDSGLTWVELRDSAPWTSIGMSSDGVLQMAIQRDETSELGSVWQSADSGITWVRADGANAFIPGIGAGCAMSADGKYRYYRREEQIIRSCNKGITWTDVLNTPLQNDTKIVVSADGKYVSANGHDRMYVSKDYGDTFIVQVLPPLTYINSASMSADGSVQMASAYGKLVKSNDYWASYTDLGYGDMISGDTSWSATGISGNGNVLIATRELSRVYLSIDRGVTWTQVTALNTGDVIGFSLSYDGSVIVAIRPNLPIAVTKDYGSTWVMVENSRLYSGISVSMSGETMAAVVSGGGIFESNNFGDSWRIRHRVYSESYTARNWIASAISNNGKYVVVASENGFMYVSDTYGKTFTRAVSSSPQSDIPRKWVSVVISGDVITGTSKHKICGLYAAGVMTSWDSGATFYNTPGNAVGDYVSAIAMSANGSKVVVPGYKDADAPNGTTIYVSTAAVETLTGGYDSSWASGGANYNTGGSIKTTRIVSLAMSTDGLIMYAAASSDPGYGISGTNGLLKWTGNVWTATSITDPTLAVACTDDGSYVDVAVADGHVYISDDAGANFTGQSSLLFGNDSTKPRLVISGDGSTRAAIIGDTLYVSYDNWVTAIEHGVRRNWKTVDISQDGQRMIAGVYDGGLYQSFDKGDTFGSHITRKTDIKTLLDGGSNQVSITAGRELYTLDWTTNTWYADGPTGVWKDCVVAETGSQSCLVIPVYGIPLMRNSPTTNASQWSDWDQWIQGGPLSWPLPLPLTPRRWAACAISRNGEHRILIAENASIYRSGPLTIAGTETSTWPTATSVTKLTLPEATLPIDWRSCCVNNTGSIWLAVAYNGYLYRSTDGDSWTAVGGDINTDVRQWVSVAMNEDGSIAIALDYDGNAWISINNAAAWALMDGDTRKWVSVAINTVGDRRTAITYDGYIYTSTDSSPAWQQRGVIGEYSSISMSAGGAYQIAMTAGGTAYYSFDYGVSWGSGLSPELDELCDISISDDGLRLLTAKSGGAIYESMDSGLSWDVGNTNNAWASVSMSSDGSVRAASGWNGVHISAVGISGGDWVSIDSSTPPFDLGPKRDYKTVLVNKAATSSTNAVILLVCGAYGIFRRVANIWSLAYVGGYTVVTTDVCMSHDGSVQYSVALNSRIRTSNDTGIIGSWNELVSSPVLDWYSIATSSDGAVVAAAGSNSQIHVSRDSGITWVAYGPIKNWRSIEMNSDGTKQMALTDDGELYISIDSGVTWTASDTGYKYRGIAMNTTDSIESPSIQVACTKTQLFKHPFDLNERIELSMNTITTDPAIRDIAYTDTAMTSDLLPLHNFDLSQARRITKTRTTELPPRDVFIPPSNYTPETLAAAINTAIYLIDPTWNNVSPPIYGFSYNPVTKKMSFTPGATGTGIISQTNLLTQMGFTDIPNTLTKGIAIIATNIVNPELSGPLNVFIKSNIIGDLRKNKTAFSTNRNLENLIAPLELNPITNNYQISYPVEIYLSKKETIESIDIQIVDEAGNIIGLNGGNTQVNFYFYSS